MIEENNVNPIQNPNQTEVKSKVNGLNIAALVLGIVSIVLWCIWFISIPCAILSVIFGLVGLRKPGKGLAISGIITGAISVVVWVVIFALAFIGGFMIGFEDAYYDYYDDYDYSTYSYY